MRQSCIVLYAVLCAMVFYGTWAGTAEQAPSFTAPNLRGDKVYFEAAGLREPVVIFFWRSDCSPCQQQVPAVRALEREQEGGYRLLGVILDPDATKAYTAIQKAIFKFPQAHDPDGKIAKQFRISRIPQYVLVDAAGEIRYRGHQTPVLKNHLQVAIKEAPRFGLSRVSAPKPRAAGHPSFQGRTIGGTPYTFDPAHLSKPTLLTFWATWCGPCLEEVEYLKKLHQKKGAVLELVAVNLDEDPQKAKKFIQSRGIPYLNVDDHRGKISDLYGIKGIPRNFLFNQQGEKIYDGASLGRDFEKALQKVLP